MRRISYDKKLFVLIITLFLTPFVAGLYGIVHDQFTYTISPEYFTKFKLEKFHIAPTLPYRAGTLLVGWQATWWVGLIIGLCHGLTGYIHNDITTMIKTIRRATVLTLIIAFVVGLIGLAYGKFYLAKTGVNWDLPKNLVDKENFIAVGSMHNFSYLGGLIGLLMGVIYQIRMKVKG